MAPTARPSAIMGATRRFFAPGMTSARIGSSAGSNARTARISRLAQARATIESGRNVTVGISSVPNEARMIILSSAAPMTTPRGKAKRSTSPSSTVTDWRTGSVMSSRRAPISTIVCRSARRWRSSRSFIAEKTDVARANSQKDMTLRRGIRSNSIAAPATTSTAGTRSAACAYRTTMRSSESQSASFSPVRYEASSETATRCR